MKKHACPVCGKVFKAVNAIIARDLMLFHMKTTHG